MRPTLFRLAAISKFGVLLLAASVLGHASTRPHYGGTLRVEVQGDPWQAPDSIGRSLVFDSLTHVDSSGETTPALAVRWTSQNANHRWQVWLRPGVHFHDGSLFTPENALQSLTRSCVHCPWTTARALSDSIIFTTTSSDPLLPAELSRSVFAIAKQDASGTLVGTGAFRLVSNQNWDLSLAAVDDAWQGRPFVDAIHIYGRRMVRNQWLDLLSGQADVVDVPPENLRQATQEHLNILQATACDLLVLSISQTGNLSDDSQREAIGSAVNRATLYNVIFQKQGEMTASLVPDSLSGYSFLFPLEHDLARTQALHGTTTRAALTLMVDDTNAAMHLTADRIALNLQDAGFRVQVVTRTVNSETSGSPDLILRKIHREASALPSTLQQMLAAFNQSLPEDSLDPSTLYREEAAFLQTHRAVPLLYLPRAYGVGTRVRGLRLSPSGMPLLGDVSLEDAK
jgi:peptide/nickel transport system substrate-binding protein